MSNMRATVVKILDNGLMMVDPEQSLLGQGLVSVQQDDCQKFFEVGNRVKIVRGENHVGEIGQVVSVDMANSQVTVASEYLNSAGWPTEWEVNINDVIATLDKRTLANKEETQSAFTPGHGLFLHLF